MESTEAPRAFEKAYAAHGEKILAYLRRLTRDPGIAGDLAQEIFLRVSRGLAKFRGESRLSTWIYRIATNVFLDYVRAPGSRRAEERPFDAPAGESSRGSGLPPDRRNDRRTFQGLQRTLPGRLTGERRRR